MTLLEPLLSSASTIGGVVLAMVVLAGVETITPDRARGRWHRAHLGANLALSAITLVTSAVLNAALVLALFQIEAAGHRPLAPLGSIGATVLVVLVLDFAWYVAHRTMHRSRWLWRIHAVHHSDPAVDVTTTIRQHPAEGLVRYAFMGTAAVAIGAGPAAFAVYRTWSVMQGLLTHANLRVPAWLDGALAWLLVTPRVHRLHHSRLARETDSNYATITTLFDRLFGTFTPPRRGAEVAYGLDGHDDPAGQTAGALLRAPWRPRGVADGYARASRA